MHFLLVAAALLLALLVYSFSRKNFLKIFIYADAAVGVLLLLAGVVVTLIYS
jgi:hypothetical protein